MNTAILKSAFDKELEINSSYIKVSKTIAVAAFDETVSILAELPFENASVELTVENGFKLTLTFPQNKLLMISKYFDSDGCVLDEGEIIFSLFSDCNLIASNVERIESFTKGFKEFLST